MDITKGHLRAYKQRNGLWCVARDYKGNTMQYELSAEESKLMNRADADGNKSEFTALKERIFKEKVVRHEANDIARYLNYEDMKVYPSYAKDKGLKNEDQTQVWLDSKLHHKIEMLNLKHGKPVPTKYIVNAILQLYLDEHKAEISKASK